MHLSSTKIQFKKPLNTWLIAQLEHVVHTTTIIFFFFYTLMALADDDDDDAKWMKTVLTRCLDAENLIISNKYENCYLVVKGA